jgi:hypothetical protein
MESLPKKQSNNLSKDKRKEFDRKLQELREREFKEISADQCSSRSKVEGTTNPTYPGSPKS